MGPSARDALPKRHLSRRRFDQVAAFGLEQRRHLRDAVAGVNADDDLA